MDKSKTQDQVQAIYLAQANIFAYEARKSAKSWIPLCDSTVPISILYDNTRSIYRIISVDADIKEVVVNTTVIPELEFVKTTAKFGYWKDVASGRIFGIGFASEYEAEAFDECLKKVKQNIGPPSVNSSLSLTADAQTDKNNNNTRSEMNGNKSCQQTQTRFQMQTEVANHAHGDGPIVASRIPPHSTSNNQMPSAPMNKKLNWDDYEQIGPTVLSMMNAHQHAMANAAGRPATYKVDLPVMRNANNIPVPNTAGSNYGGGAISKVYSNLEDIRLPAPPPAYHFPYPSASLGGVGVTPSVPSSAITATNASLMPLALSIPPGYSGYCYQGPGSIPTKSDARNGDSYATKGALVELTNERRDLADELNRIKAENMRLTESLIESTCNAKKWELQVNSLREDNIQLVKSIADMNSKLDSLNKDCREYKEQTHRWKEHYQQAVDSAKEKGQYLKDAEDKLKCASVDKARIESVMKDLEDELRRQQAINKEVAANHVGQYTNKYFKELEEHYRKLLTDSQKRIEEVLRKDNDRKNVLRGVDTLFTGAIQGLINIHGQIRQAYEQ